MGSNGFTTRPELRGTFGAVASTHWLASATGMAVLERGGNAFDAACAARFVLQVVEPHLNGPGGDLPVVFWSAERGEKLWVEDMRVATSGEAVAEIVAEKYLDEAKLGVVGLTSQAPTETWGGIPATFWAQFSTALPKASAAPRPWISRPATRKTSSTSAIWRAKRPSSAW